jgi:hypothetical protein
MRSQGTRLYVQELEPDTPANITAITSAKPTVITFGALPDTFVEGRVVIPDGTGWKSIDGMPFQISDVTGLTITLADSDTSDEADDAVLGTVSAVDLIEFCMATFGNDEPAGPDIDTTTMCDTARRTEAGLNAISTWTATGFWDSADASQTRLRELKRSGDNVVFAAQFRDSSGLVFSGNVKNLNVTAGVDQSVNISLGGTVDGTVHVLGSLPLIHTGAVS